MIGGGSTGMSLGEVTTGSWAAVNRVVKLADTLVLAFIVTVQLPIPLQAPPQLARPQAADGLAVSVTRVPGAKFALQIEPQLITAGELATRPPGLPMIDTDRVLPPPLSWKTVPQGPALLVPQL
jgi:hypothetical protein